MTAERLQTASMPNVLIRDLPAEAHAVLSRRANDAGMSLQKFLVRELTRYALTPTMAEFFDGYDMSDFGAVDVDAVVDEIRADRER
jgi:hypothetical protein